MSRILAYTSPAKGHLYPVTSILRELQSRGHDVEVRTLASEMDTMRALGFRAVPVDPRVEAVALQDWRHRSPQKALAASVSAFVERAPFDAADLERAIEQENPAVVIVDINSWCSGRGREVGWAVGRVLSVSAPVALPRDTALWSGLRPGRWAFGSIA